MSSSISSPVSHPIAVAAEIDGASLHVTLADGRELRVPLAWFDWLADATPSQRADLEIIEGGEGIWWDALENSLSVPALFGLPHR